MHAVLVHGHGLKIGRNTVGLLMRRVGLVGLPIYRRRGKRTPPGVTVTDLIKRNFRRTGPNQLWAADITEHPRLGFQRSLQHRLEMLIVAGGRLG